MKKLLITGASGFIGSFLVEEALAGGYEVYAGIRGSSSKQYLTDPSIRFLDLDFADTRKLRTQLTEAPRFDYIIHNAAVTKSVSKAGYYVNNYNYTRNFVSVLIALGKVPAKFIYMSSLAAFGPGDAKSGDPIRPDDLQRPVTSYGKSKLASEKFIASLEDFPYVFIRPTTVYGPREKDLLTVFKLINNNLEFIIGSGKQRLSFVYVKDLVKAVLQVMASNVVNKGYFVSDGGVYDARELGRIIRQALGKKTLSIRVPVPLARLIAGITESSKYFNGRQAVLNLEKMNELEGLNWHCDISPLLAEHNFRPQYDLQRGVPETVEWYRQMKWLG